MALKVLRCWGVIVICACFAAGCLSEVPRDDREVVFERMGWEARALYCMCK